MATSLHVRELALAIVAKSWRRPVEDLRPRQTRAILTEQDARDLVAVAEVIAQWLHNSSVAADGAAVIAAPSSARCGASVEAAA